MNLNPLHELIVLYCQTWEILFSILLWITNDHNLNYLKGRYYYDNFKESLYYKASLVNRATIIKDVLIGTSIILTITVLYMIFYRRFKRFMYD